MQEIAALAESYFGAAGTPVQRYEPVPGRVSLVASVRGGGPRTLAFNGHLDVVPAGDAALWRVDPYGGELLDGRIWGRGVADMKSKVAAAMISPAFFKNAARRCPAPGWSCWSRTRRRGLTMDVVCDFEPYYQGVGAEIVQVSRAALRDLRICADPCPVFKGSFNDCRHFQRAGIPSVVLGHDGSGGHVPDEHCSVEEIVQTACLYAAVAFEFLGGGAGG